MKKSIVLCCMALLILGLSGCEPIALRAETIPVDPSIEGVVGPQEEEQIEAEYRSREELLLAALTETDPAKLKQINQQIAEIDERLKALGVTFYTSSWTSEEHEQFIQEPFMDDDGFGEVIKEAGFEVTREGCSILLSGFNRLGEEYRVITDSSGVNCEKIALVVKSHGKEWVVRHVSSERDSTGLLCLRDVPEVGGKLFGFRDQDGKYIRCGAEQHRFFQGNNAVKPISSDELNVKIQQGVFNASYPGVFSQVWQDGEYYIIHLMYYGPDDRLGLENLVSKDLHEMLLQMGCVAE